MTETELTDLLHTAARASSPDGRPDPGALISRARNGRRRRRLTVLGAVAAVGLAAAAVPFIGRQPAGVEVATGRGNDPQWADAPQPGWTRLEDAPLSRRTGAISAWTGREVVVFGGSPHPHGSPAPEPDLADGAAFDPATGKWRRIADAPVKLSRRFAVAVGRSLYVRTACPTTSCTGSRDELLRYRAADDAWDILPVPDGAGVGHLLLPFGDDLVVVDAHPEGRTPVDWRFATSSASWERLPDDPLPPAQVRDMRVEGEDLLVFSFGGPAPSTTASTMSAARLEAATGAWKPLPPAPGQYHANAIFDGVAFPFEPGPASGGIFDASAEAWRPLPLPVPPAASVTAPGRLVGVLREGSARYVAASGLVLDIANQRWIELSPPGGRTATEITGALQVADSFSTTVSAVGRRQFRFEGPEDELMSPDRRDRNLAWVWTPPADVDVTVPPPPVEDPAPPPPGLTPTSAAPPAPPPSVQPTPGAPVFVSATGDAAAGQVTLRFDRPVTGDPVDKSPGSKSFGPDKTHPMNMIVFGPDQACTSPQGNGQDYVSGLGTDTVTFAATSLAPGTTYVGIGRGVVKAVADGTFNDAVVVKDRPTTAMFAGMSCIPLEVTWSVPTTSPYVDPAGGPALVSATATAGAGGPQPAPGLGAGRITLKFDKPVVPGDGSYFDGAGPNRPPPSGDTSMGAMQLVVHTTDSTCSSPNGNAHAYLDGVGTDTLTVDATSLVVGTTYISISPGFAKGQADGKAMRWVRCFALTVTP